MHYSRHRPTACVAYKTTLILESTNDQWARPACPLIISSKTKPCQFSSVQLRRSVYMRLSWTYVGRASLTVNE